MSAASSNKSDLPREPHGGDEPDAAPTGDPTSEEIYYCDLCGAAMLNVHCKLTCERCGYKRDCSDP